MTKDQVLTHFGSQGAVAVALSIKQPSVANWKDPLPELRQLEIEVLTQGVLTAGPECDRYRVPQPAAGSRQMGAVTPTHPAPAQAPV